MPNTIIRDADSHDIIAIGELGPMQVGNTIGLPHGGKNFHSLVFSGLYIFKVMKLVSPNEILVREQGA